MFDTARLSLLVTLLLPCAACDRTTTRSSVGHEPRSWLSSACCDLEASRAPSGPTLSVISYNVNFGLASCGGDPMGTPAAGPCRADPDTVELLEALDADVLMLQETTPAWEAVLRPRLAARYPHATFHGPGHYTAGGNATLSKLPILKDESLPSPLRWFPANRLVVAASFGELELLNVHLRPAISERGSWVEGYFSTGHLRKREIDSYLPSLDPKLPTIVAGDFNEDTNGAALETLAKLGFESALSEQDRSAKTWHWTAYGLPLALTLDHVAYETSAFVVESAEVIPGGRSDHQPVRVVLRKR